MATVERELLTGARRSTAIAGGHRLELVHRRPLEPLEELPRVGAEALDEAALPLGVQRVDGEARLARARDARQANELAFGEVDRNGAKVVGASADEVSLLHLRWTRQGSLDAVRARDKGHVGAERTAPENANLFVMGIGSPHLMLLVSTTGYTGDAFLEAARFLGVPTLVGSDRCHVLSEEWPLEGRVTLDFRHPDEAVGQLVEASRERPLGAIVPTSETTARIAALASEKLGLRHNPPAAAHAAANKRIMRELLEAAGVAAPRARMFSVDDDPDADRRERSRFPAC